MNAIALPSVMLIDDHAVVREGMASLLEVTGKFGRIIQANDGSKALELLAKFQPALIVVDLMMPGLAGPELVQALKQQSPNSSIAVLTSTEDEKLTFDVLAAGAQSFLMKSMSGEEILAALESIIDGVQIIHPSVHARIMSVALQSKTQKDPFEELTPREAHVLRELAAGGSNARIAQILDISERTVKSHVGNILSKLHLNDRTEAVAFAWRNGLMKEGKH